MSHNEMLCDVYDASSKADERAYQRDELIYNVTEDILILLEDMNISKKELARRLGKSQSYITQMLSGSRNMTLSSLSDICYALDKKVTMRINNRHIDETPEFDATNDTTSLHVNQYEPFFELKDKATLIDKIISSKNKRHEHYIIQKQVAVVSGLIRDAVDDAKYQLSGWHSLAFNSYEALIHSGRNISVERRGDNIIDRRDVNHWQKEVA